MKVEVEIDVPAGRVSQAELEALVRRETVLALFADRKIPAGQATRELGLTRWQFLDLLKERGIPAVDYTLADFEDDKKDFEKIRPEIEAHLAKSGIRRLE